MSLFWFQLVQGADAEQSAVAAGPEYKRLLKTLLFCHYGHQAGVRFLGARVQCCSKVGLSCWLVKKRDLKVPLKGDGVGGWGPGTAHVELCVWIPPLHDQGERGCPSVISVNAQKTI